MVSRSGPCTLRCIRSTLSIFEITSRGKCGALPYLAEQVGCFRLRFIIRPHNHLGEDSHEDALHTPEEEHDRQERKWCLDKVLGIVPGHPVVGKFEIEHSREAEQAQADRDQANPAEQMDGSLSVFLIKKD